MAGEHCKEWGKEEAETKEGTVATKATKKDKEWTNMTVQTKKKGSRNGIEKLKHWENW